MENQINNPQGTHHTTNTKTITGIILLGIGLTVLFGRSNFFMFPGWFFSWPVILIIIGLCVGAKNNFKKSNWIILTMLGVIFLLPNIIPGLGISTLWPLFIIAIGANMLIRRNHRWNQDHWEKRDDKQYPSFD